MLVSSRYTAGHCEAARLHNAKGITSQTITRATWLSREIELLAYQLHVMPEIISNSPVYLETTELNGHY